MLKQKGIVKFFSGGLLAVFMAASAHAQFRAALQGTVVDSNGGLVPEASVTLTSQETQVARKVSTSGEGVFTISALAPGRYTLSVEKTGFSKKTLTDVQVGAEQSQSINVQLDIGQTTESVTVAAPAAELLDTETATIGGTITNREIHALPSFARDPYQLLRLAPGVFGDGAQGAGGNGSQLPGTNRNGPSSTDSIFQVENGPAVVANGARQNANNFQVDGLSVNSTVWGGAAVITPNEESVKEVRVVANNYSAETGRTSGAQIEVVSQNGTNDVHGSAFFKWHRPGLNAFQKWNGPGTPSPVQRDESRFNQLGGSIGGPLWKNKLFAFFSYETLRNSSQTVGTAWFETPQFLASAGPSGSIARQFLSYPGTAPAVRQVISQTCAQLGIPSTQCHDVPGGLDLGSPLKTALGTADPTFAQPGTPFGIGGGFDGVPDAMFVQTAFPNRVADVQYNGRVDYNLSSKDVIAFSIYWVPVETHALNGPARTSNYWNHLSIADSISGIYNHTFSPSLLNEARFGESGWNWNEFNTNAQAPFGFPFANITNGGVGFQNFGAPGFSVFNQKTFNGRDTLTKVAGSHYMKFGADISRALFLDEAPWAGRPSYDFHNLWDFANDAPYHESGNFDPRTGQPTSAIKNLRFNILGFFAQDDWKVRPNLTLNLGLRYEYFSPLTETKGDISNVILGSGANALAGLRVKKGGNLFDTSKNNWGPQLGFAWTPKEVLGRDFSNKLVIRGGFGVGYNLEQLAITSNGRFNPPFLTAFDLFGSDILYALNSNLHQFTNYPANPVTKQSFDPVTGLPTTGAALNLTGFPSNMPTSVTYRYSLDTQYALGGNWVASIGYQGSQSRHLTIQDNLSLLLYPQTNPAVHSLSWYSNYANSSFNALLTEVQHRFARNYEVDFQYRYSKNTDLGSQDYFSTPYPWDRRFAVGPADFDVTHNLKIYGVWSPRFFGSGNNWLAKAVGGWTVSTIINAHSGFPWTPQYCNTNGNVVFPNSGFGCLFAGSYSGGASSDHSNSVFQSPNGDFPKGALSYFTVPTYPTNGIPPPPANSIHRNQFRGPNYLGTDMVLAKDIIFGHVKFLGEGTHLRLQASAYNLFNKLNLTLPNTTFSNDGVTSNPQFGQSQGAYSGRIVELQARFSF